MVLLCLVDHLERPVLGKVVAIIVNDFAYERIMPEFDKLMWHHNWSLQLPYVVLRIAFSTDLQASGKTVSYTHLTLPTKRIV